MSKATALTMLTNTTAPAPSTPPVTATNGGAPGLQAIPDGQTPVTEAPKELESTRFAHLAKKEAELVKQRETFKKEQEEIKAEREKMREIHKKLQDFEELKAKDKLAALRLAGFTDNDIFEMFAQQEDTRSPEEKAAQAAQTEINKFKDEQKKAQDEAQQARNTQVINNFKKDITVAISSDKDKYEYCNHFGPEAEDLIYETVTKILSDEGELITIQEAADMIESFYENQDKSMATLKKRQPKVEAPATEVQPAATAPEVKQVQAPVRPASKTLSSKTTATVASTTVTRRETPAEKRARLVAKLSNLGK
jgi:hypothetical protein